MDRIRLHRDRIAFVAAVVLPLGVAAVLVPFRSSFANTAAALILVAVDRGGRGGGEPAGRVRRHGLGHRVVRLLPHPAVREAGHHAPGRHRDRREPLGGRDHRDRARRPQPLPPCDGRRGGGLRRPHPRRHRARHVRRVVPPGRGPRAGRAGRPVAPQGVPLRGRSVRSTAPCGWSTTARSSSAAGPGASTGWACPAPRSSCWSRIRAARWDDSS